MLEQKCECGKKKGPFFTVTVVAMEVGRGTRMPGAERRQYRRIVGSRCLRCLRSARVTVLCKNLLPKRIRKVAVYREENPLLAMDTATENLRG